MITYANADGDPLAFHGTLSAEDAALVATMVNPYDCDSCGAFYDEGDGEAHDGICPACTPADWCCDPHDPRDCEERATCPDAGASGHSSCGTCPTHGQPRHRGGCSACPIA